MLAEKGDVARRLTSGGYLFHQEGTRDEGETRNSDSWEAAKGRGGERERKKNALRNTRQKEQQSKPSGPQRSRYKCIDLFLT